MLAYAANRPVAARAPSSPPAMLLIISAHVALIALIMSAKMEFQPVKHPRTKIVFVPKPIDPPPAGHLVNRRQPANGRVDDPQWQGNCPHCGCHDDQHCH